MKIARSLIASAVIAVAALAPASAYAQAQMDHSKMDHGKMADMKTDASKDITEGEIRKVDKDNRVLVYVAISTKLVNGSPANSVSVVPLWAAR